MENVKNINADELQLFMSATSQELLNNTKFLSININIKSLQEITGWDFQDIHDLEVRNLNTCLEYEDWLHQKEVNFKFNNGARTFIVSNEIICTLNIKLNSQIFTDIHNIIKNGDYVYFNQWDLK